MVSLKNLFSNKATPKKNQRQIYSVKQDIYTLASQLPISGNWLGDTEIEKIEEDSTVSSSISIRKSATLKKEVVIQTDNKDIKALLEQTFDFDFLQQSLDCALQGMSVFEINWSDDDKFLTPKLVERNYRDFSLQDGNLIYSPNQEPVDPAKAIYATFKPKFDKPLGRPLYHTLFWLRRFKAGSISFWLDYMEKFSTPWTIGTTGSGDKDEMAKNLYAMLGGDAAVIDEDDKVEIITPKAKGDFKELSIYCDDQIRELLLGGNLTGEIKGASLAAAKVHNDIREDIAMIDQQITLSLMKQVVKIFKEINNITIDITVLLKEHDTPNYALAERDVKVYEMSGGKFTFTKDYLEETYQVKLQEGRADTTMANKLLSLSSNKPTDHIDKEKNGVSTKDIENRLLADVEKMFDEAESFEEAIEILGESFPDFNTSDIEELIEKLYANSMIYGIAKVEDENQGEV